MCHVRSGLNPIKIDDFEMPLPSTDSHIHIVSLFDEKIGGHLGFFPAIWPRSMTKEIDTLTNMTNLARQMDGMLHIEVKLRA